MKKQYFIPRTDLDKQLWLQNFAAKLPTYKAKYGIGDPEVDDMKDSSEYFAFWLNAKKLFEEFLKNITQFKNDLRDDINSTPQEPVAPVLSGIPKAVVAGIFTRAASIAAGIKSKTNYSVADGEDLGIEGAETAGRNMADMKPVFTLRLASGGHPEIVWSKQGMDGINIYVNRGNNVWQYVAMDSYPNYTDTAPLPAVGATALWQYKIVFRLDDEEVGQFSDVAGITVTGNV